MYVSDILRTKGTALYAVSPSASVTEAVDRLNRHRIGALAVLNAADELVGIFSERDVVRHLATRGEGILTLQVQDLMTRHPQVCRPDDTIKDVMVRMTVGRMRHLPVVEGSTLKGLVSIGDVVKHRLTELQTEANVLRDALLASL